eukprot:TRINITY_DN450_c0_g1_i1.p1 TRINITY_DN450_c0_g1~~TRINITY_DN450_c0_g1_i1.p1  ORF type:complete len:928 (+),score=177.48 TRINITY_DN450_c0_g1_i1:32-2815(+)
MGGTHSAEIFQPPAEASYDNSLEGIIWMPSTEERHIPALYIKWKGKSGERAFFTILYSSSNFQDLGMINLWLRIISETLKVDILCYEYTGFGLNEGKASEETCYEDIFSAWSFLTLLCRIPSERIILMGKSLGSGVSVELAYQLYTQKATQEGRGIFHNKKTKYTFLEPNKKIGGLILQSPMTSVMDIAKDKGKLPAIAQVVTNDMFENIKKIDVISCPVFIVHGTEDDIIPVAHSKKLEAKLGESCWKYLELPEARHFDIETTFSNELLEGLLEFIDHLLPPERKIDRTPKTPFIPPIYASPNDVVSSWLSRVGLTEYTQKFVIAGFYDVPSLASLSEIDMECIGVEDAEHQKTLLAAAKELSEQSKEAVVTLKPEETTRDKSGSFYHPQFAQSNVFKIIDFSEIELSKNIRKGYHDECYKANWRGTSVLVRILKSMREDLPSFHSRLLLFGGLKHPNLVELVGYCEGCNEPTIVEEWVAEGSLWRFLRQNEKLPGRLQISFSQQILDGLLYLSSLSPPISHGRLSSKNIMLYTDHSSPNQNMRLKLGGYLQWKPLSFLWMAPELILQNDAEAKVNGEKVDVYSVGIILWELMTCKIPYSSFLSASAAIRVATEEFRLSLTSGSPPTQLWTKLIEQCWASDPTKRPTLREVDSKLEQIEERFLEKKKGQLQDKSPNLESEQVVFPGVRLHYVPEEKKKWWKKDKEKEKEKEKEKSRGIGGGEKDKEQRQKEKEKYKSLIKDFLIKPSHMGTSTPVMLSRPSDPSPTTPPSSTSETLPSNRDPLISSRLSNNSRHNQSVVTMITKDESEAISPAPRPRSDSYSSNLLIVHSLPHVEGTVSSSHPLPKATDFRMDPSIPTTGKTKSMYILPENLSDISLQLGSIDENYQSHQNQVPNKELPPIPKPTSKHRRNRSDSKIKTSILFHKN